MNYFKNAKFFRRMALALLVLPCFFLGEAVRKPIGILNS